MARKALRPDRLAAFALAPCHAGVDEAGRGPLAGAVYAGAVILNPARPIKGLADSKLLSATRRDILFDEIREYSQAWAIATASVAEIDALNILQASLLAMRRAVEQLAVLPSEICVDGLHVPAVTMNARAIVEGDRHVPAISAASILAKVARDREMCVWDARYPDYGFAQHKGYATAAHLAALQRHGPCEIHRLSFAPVRNAAAQRRLAF